MSPIAWLVATTVAGVTMVSFASGYVYTRTEGILLEKKVDSVSDRGDKMSEEMKRRLERIEEKIDRIAERRH